MNWDDYRYFLALARRGTLRSAAKSLDVDQATVGRRLNVLEETLGTKLFEKRSNGYVLTSAGERIRETVASTEEAFLQVERLAAGRDEKLEGVIRVAMPGALANHFVIPQLGKFLKDYPSIEIDFLTGPEVVNLSRRDAEIAVRLVRPENRELIVKRIGRVELALYGAKGFTPDEQTPFIGLFDFATSAMEREILSKLDFEPRYQLRSAAWSSVHAAVAAGLGIGLLPTFMEKKNSDVKRLQKFETLAPLWLVQHPEIAKSARVKKLAAYLSTLFAD